MRIDLFDIEEKTMELQELKDLLQKSGIVGAGGAEIGRASCRERV